jgi:Arc/MetJ-type ribon-helix-helix transcriptional regulator
MPRLNHVIFRADDDEIERLLRLAKIYGGNKSAAVRMALDLLEAQTAEQSKALAA